MNLYSIIFRVYGERKKRERHLLSFCVARRKRIVRQIILNFFCCCCFAAVDPFYSYSALCICIATCFFVCVSFGLCHTFSRSFILVYKSSAFWLGTWQSDLSARSSHISLYSASRHSLSSFLYLSRNFLLLYSFTIPDFNDYYGLSTSILFMCFTMHVGGGAHERRKKYIMSNRIA